MNNIISTLAELSKSDASSTAGAAGALVVFFIFALIFAFAIAIFVFWVMALIHLIQHEDVKDRTLWLVLLFVVGGVIGPVYHFAVRKPYENQKPSSSKK
jgi:TctA family transporter